MKSGGHDGLLRFLRAWLTAGELAGLEDLHRPARAEEYDALFEGAASGLAALEAEVDGFRSLATDRYGELAEQPEGRRQVVLRNSPPQLLVALARAAIRRSWERRFDDPRRSLRFATLGAEAAAAAAEVGYPSPEDAADLEAEALGYLANARRITSDLVGAERTLTKAFRHLDRGTGDRYLKADLLVLQGSLRWGQGDSEGAARTYDREIALRRVLGDRRKLADALVNRGIVASWSEPLAHACPYLREGVSLLEDGHDPEFVLLALMTLAESLARDGQGLQAWKVVCKAETAIRVLREPSLNRTLRWIRGLTYRALGQLREAEEDLRAVRDGFLEESLTFRAALASLDLAAVYAARGRTAEIRELAGQAYAVFRRECMERRALAAFMVFHRAAEAETLTEKLAVEVANFLVRSSHDRRLRFEPAEQ